MSSPTSFYGFEPFDELEIDEANDNDLKLKIGKKKYIPIEEFTSIQCAKTKKSTRVRKTLISRNFHHVTVSEDAKSSVSEILRMILKELMKMVDN